MRSIDCELYRFLFGLVLFFLLLRRPVILYTTVIKSLFTFLIRSGPLVGRIYQYELIWKKSAAPSKVVRSLDSYNFVCYTNLPSSNECPNETCWYNFFFLIKWVLLFDFTVNIMWRHSFLQDGARTLSFVQGFGTRIFCTNLFEKFFFIFRFPRDV